MCTGSTHTWRWPRSNKRLRHCPAWTSTTINPMQPTLTFEGLGVYLPEEILSQVEAIAAGRGVTAQELLEQTMFANRRCRNLELSPKARGILEHGEPWPSDPLEALQVGAILAFE